MKVKCIDPRLNHVVFDENRKPRKVKVGETFKVKKIPAKWKGLVAPVDETPDAETPAAVTEEPKKAVTNPASAPAPQPDSKPAAQKPAAAPKSEPQAAAPAKPAASIPAKK